MFSTPLICSSIGVTTVEDTTSALAPGYWPVTLIKGGAISGYCAIGSRKNDTEPRITKMTETTAAKIGRSMKKCEMRMRLVRLGLCRVFRRGRCRRRALFFHRHLYSRPGAHQAIDDHAIGRGQPLPDHTQVVIDLAGNHIFLPNDTAIVDHQHVLARLLGADRRVGNKQRSKCRRTRYADAPEHARCENTIGIGKDGATADCARGPVDNIIDEIHFAAVSKVGFVDQLKRDGNGALAVGAHLPVAPGDALVTEV